MSSPGILEVPDLWRTLAENSFDGVMIIDPDQRIVFWNCQAKRITGFSPADVLGQNCLVGVCCPSCLRKCGLFTQGEICERTVTMMSGGVIEVDREDLRVHVGGPWVCTRLDWGLDLHVHGDVAFVGSWKGIHVFSLERPWDPYEVAFMRMDLPVVAMTSLGNLLYVAQGDDVVVLDASDPSGLVEVGRTSLDGSIVHLDVNREDRKVVALTPLELVVLDTIPNPAWPVLSGSISLIGWSFEDMRVDGPWIYLSGWWTQSFHDSGAGGLQRMGWHDLKEWVEGSSMDGRVAERINEDLNRYEAWVEAPY